jgi:hypothetical protein
MLEHTSAYVSIRQHMSAYVSIRQRVKATNNVQPVSIHQHTSAYVRESMPPTTYSLSVCVSIRQLAHVLQRDAPSIRQHTRQHTSAYLCFASACPAARRTQNTSAYVSIRQHTCALLAHVLQRDAPSIAAPALGGRQRVRRKAGGGRAA